jgi:N-acyl-D-aspartate/D-glutamate deacylase
MKIVRSLLVWAFPFIPIVCSAQSAVITNVTVIDGTGAAPKPNSVIVVRDKKLVAVGPRGHLNVPVDAPVIDGTGKYVIPGLIDTNVHLILNTAPEWLGKYEGRFNEVATEAAQVELKNGVTTCLTYGGRCSRCSMFVIESAAERLLPAVSMWQATLWD